jgi:hypothetical protein
MKLTKSLPGNMASAKIPTAVSYGADAPSLDADTGKEDINPQTGADMDDMPPGSLQLQTPRINNSPISHEGDMGRLSPLESTTFFRE